MSSLSPDSLASTTQSFFASVLSHMGQPFMMVDDEGTILKANASAMLMLGTDTSPEHKPLSDFFPDFDSFWPLTSESEGVVSAQLVPEGQDAESGKPEPCVLRCGRCAPGDPWLLLLEPDCRNVVLDSSLPTMLQNLPLPVHIVDKDWCLLDANAAWFEMTGYGRADVIGRRWLDRLEDSDRKVLNRLEPVFEGHNSVGGIELSYQTANQHAVRVQVSASPLETTEGQLFAIVTAVDIEARKEHANRLADARDTAQAANRAKNAFLANMSHELRTPLNGILGYAQILGRDESLVQKHHQAITTIRESGEYLLTLINDILDLAKLDSQKVQPASDPLQLIDLVESVVDLATTRAKRNGLTLTSHIGADVPAVVVGDGRMIRQVLLNLLSNAVKYTEQGGATLTVTRNDAGGISFSVQDTGPGVSEEEREVIFEPFEQTQSDGSTAGAGLGLAISSELVAAMGGKLELESTSGHGSRFFFSLDLPVANESQVRRLLQSYRRRVGYEGERISIMVVDDRRENRVVMSNMLTPLGFEVSTAMDGKEALALIEETQPDVVLMDLVMPQLDGFEAIRRLRADESLSDLIVIAFSASVFDDDRALSLHAGADAFIPKPVNLEHFLDELERLMPIDWVERDIRSYPSGQPKKDVGDEELIPFSPETLNLLREAAATGRILDVRKEVENLFELSRSRDETRHIAFLEHLNSLIDQFDLEGVCEFIDSFSTTTSEA